MRYPRRRWCRGHPLCEQEATRECAYCGRAICANCVAVYVGPAMLEAGCRPCHDRQVEAEEEIPLPPDELAPHAEQLEVEADLAYRDASYEPRDRKRMHREEQRRGPTEVLEPEALNAPKGPRRDAPDPSTLGGDWGLAALISGRRPEADVPFDDED